VTPQHDPAEADPDPAAVAERLRLLAHEHDQLRLRVNALDHRLTVRTRRRLDHARWRAGRALRRLSGNPLPDLGILFDADYYLRVNADVAVAGVDPLAHFLEVGWLEGRDPNPLFDCDWYASGNGLGEVGNPLLHYIHSGADEGMDPSPWFCTSWYREQAKLPAGVDPLSHYLTTGSSGTTDPTAWFDAAKYLADNPDVAAAGANPLAHYVSIGRLEGRTAPSALSPITTRLTPRRDGPELQLLLERYAPRLSLDLGQRQPAQQSPLVSVLVRTQGRRPGLLKEALLCLAAQECEDFEVLIAIHNPHPDDLEATTRIAAEMAPLLPNETQTLVVHGGDRGRPILTGQRQSSGRYCVVLDDDDHVTADWISAFAEAHASRADVVLRSLAVSRLTAEVPRAHGSLRVAAGGPQPEYCDAWSLVDHVRANRTPIHAYATPSWIRSVVGLEVDESLTVLEDWDYLLKAAITCGVQDSGRVTALYNRGGHGSADEVASSDWRAIEDRVRTSILTMPVISRLLA
jgi:hypothetical protein